MIFIEATQRRRHLGKCNMPPPRKNNWLPPASTTAWKTQPSRQMMYQPLYWVYGSKNEYVLLIWHLQNSYHVYRVWLIFYLIIYELQKTKRSAQLLGWVSRDSKNKPPPIDIRASFLIRRLYIIFRWISMMTFLMVALLAHRAIMRRHYYIDIAMPSFIIREIISATTYSGLPPPIKSSRHA